MKPDLRILVREFSTARKINLKCGAPRTKVYCVLKAYGTKYDR